MRKKQIKVAWNLDRIGVKLLIFGLFLCTLTFKIIKIDDL